MDINESRNTITLSLDGNRNQGQLRYKTKVSVSYKALYTLYALRISMKVRCTPYLINNTANDRLIK